MNLFLGYFIPLENQREIELKIFLLGKIQTENIFFFFITENVWDLPTDYFMHNPPEDTVKSLEPLTNWLGDFIPKYLPYSADDANRIVDELIRVHSRDLEMIDFYSSYHMPYRWTSFEENIAFQISILAKCFTPTFRTNFSPFEAATRRREGRGILKNPSLTGQSSTGSANSSTSSSSEEGSSSDDDDSILESSMQPSIATTTDDSESHSKRVTFNTMFPTMAQIYQTNLKPASLVDMTKFKSYVKMGKILGSNAPMASYNPKKPLQNRHKRVVHLNPLADYGSDNYKHVKAPVVDPESIRIYEAFVSLPDEIYNRAPSRHDYGVISRYISLLDSIDN